MSARAQRRGGPGPALARGAAQPAPTPDRRPCGGRAGARDRTGPESSPRRGLGAAAVVLERADPLLH